MDTVRFPTGLTVDELTAYLEDKFRQDPILAELVVRGELLEFKRHTSGHVYFTLGGKKNRLSGVMFRTDASRMVQWPRKGDEVVIRGQISIYGVRGTYQVYARRLLPLGQGAKARAREELRQRLEAEGLFDPRRKRALVPYPSKVAVVTSPTGAAVRDVLKVAGNRFPQAGIVVVPTLVQGVDAPGRIVEGLRRASGVPGVELVLLVRGGGSRDDLNPFDEEEVVRAVASCAIPVVTGVGHQVDRTLCDLAADFVTPTPSAAAEMVMPDRRDLARQVRIVGERMSNSLVGCVRFAGNEVREMALRGEKALQRGHLLPAVERTDDLRRRLVREVRGICDGQRQCLQNQAGLLQGLSPLFPLSRGYAVVEDLSSRRVTSIEQVEPGQEVHVVFRDGKALARLESLASVTPDAK